MPYLFKSPDGMLDSIVSCRIIVVESFYIRKLKKQKKNSEGRKMSKDLKLEH